MEVSRMERAQWPEHVAYALECLSPALYDDASAAAWLAGFRARWGAVDEQALAAAALKGRRLEDRLFGFRALGHLRTPAAHALLSSQLDSPRLSDRLASALSLVEAGEAEALPHLRAVLPELLPTSLSQQAREDEEVIAAVRFDVPLLLGRLGDTASVPALRRALLQAAHLIELWIADTIR